MNTRIKNILISAVSAVIFTTVSFSAQAMGMRELAKLNKKKQQRIYKKKSAPVVVKKKQKPVVKKNQKNTPKKNTNTPKKITYNQIDKVAANCLCCMNNNPQKAIDIFKGFVKHSLLGKLRNKPIYNTFLIIAGEIQKYNKKKTAPNFVEICKKLKINKSFTEKYPKLVGMLKNLCSQYQQKLKEEERDEEEGEFEDNTDKEENIEKEDNNDSSAKYRAPVMNEAKQENSSGWFNWLRNKAFGKK